MSAQIEKRNLLKDFLAKEYNRLIAYINQYFQNEFYQADAEDIIQDVALNIYSKLDLNAPVENLAGYFYRSVRNRIIDLQRKPKRIISYENYTDDRNENVILKNKTDEASNYDLAKDEKMQRKLMEAIEKLNPDQQAIIIETEFEGRSFDELAKRWGVPIGTLLSRKHRALMKLQEILT